ncbi:MAG: hypothetical protein WC519_00040 [Parcubacteria group bacterium]
MKKKSSKVILIVVLSLAALGIIAGILVSFCYKPYMAVYLTTGNIYFGKTSLFPCVKMQDPWFFQSTEDGGLSFQRFSDAVWAPKTGMKINRNQIVFMSKLSETSPIIATMEGKGVPQQQFQQTGVPDVSGAEIDEGN